jgi:hypothetical protein
MRHTVISPVRLPWPGKGCLPVSPATLALPLTCCRSFFTATGDAHSCCVGYGYSCGSRGRFDFAFATTDCLTTAAAPVTAVAQQQHCRRVGLLLSAAAACCWRVVCRCTAVYGFTRCHSTDARARVFAGARARTCAHDRAAMVAHTLPHFLPFQLL